MKCKTCKSPCTWAGIEESGHGKCFVGYTPITNADRIRAMSDEELRDTFFWIQNNILRQYNSSYLGLLDWLKQEAAENKFIL